MTSLFRNDMPTLMGIRVMPSPHVQPVPVIQVRDIKLKDGTPILSPAFRAEMNRWFLERFGTVDVAYMFDRSAFGPGGILMNPKQVAMLQMYSRDYR